MKTAIRQELVKIGRVVRCGRSWAFVRPADGSEEIHLYWSHLRRVELGPGGGAVFSTGERRTIHPGDWVVFVPRDGLWLWGLNDEYQSVVATNEQAMQVVPPATPIAPPSMTPTPPTPVINLEQEILALGSERLRSWKRRYGQQNHEKVVRELVGRSGW